jgi:hypothetical protein
MCGRITKVHEFTHCLALSVSSPVMVRMTFQTRDHCCLYVVAMDDDFIALADSEDRPLDIATASTVLRHLRPEHSIIRSELSDFTLYRNQREVMLRALTAING